MKNDDSAIEILENKKNSTALDEKTLTIVEAASEVIKRYGRPLTMKQIYEGIEKEGLYSFGAKKPLNVVYNIVRSYCEGVDWGIYSKLHFGIQCTS